MADEYKILTIPFGRDALPDMVNEIPDDPSIVDPQLASYKQGFPYITTIPLVAGGIPPEGQDFNGILRDITEHVVHQNKGGMYKFAPEVVAAGGYPKGAVMASNDDLSLWMSLVDSNVEDFNSGTPTQWARIAFSGLDSLLNNKLDKSAVVQSTGASTTNVMSQKAVTDALGQVQVQIATTAQAQALTSDGVVITPKKLADAFAGANQGFADSGYQKLPGGLIIQWGISATGGDGVGIKDIVFPVAFPVALTGLSVTAGADDGAVNASWHASSVAGFRAVTRNVTTGLVNTSFYYIAIGY